MRTTTFLSLICAAGVLCGAAACSDEGEETTSTSATSSSSTSATTTGATTSSSSGGGEGGGATTATTTTATTGTGGGGGAGGDGSGGAGGGGVSTLVNGCDPATATDLSGTNPTIDFAVQGAFKYAPACIKIAVGDQVTWAPAAASSFNAHPLVGGTVAGGVKTPDAASPILKTTSGNTAVTFTFDAAGTFGFYCDLHASSGMAGAVFVE